MMSIRKSLIYFLIFTIIGSAVAYWISNSAYDDKYDYDGKGYGYAVGDTEVAPPDPVFGHPGDMPVEEPAE